MSQGVDSKAGSWQQSSGLLQPAWLFRRKASPFPDSPHPGWSFFDVTRSGLESRLLATVQWTVATGMAFPQKSESVPRLPHPGWSFFDVTGSGLESRLLATVRLTVTPTLGHRSKTSHKMLWHDKKRLRFCNKFICENPLLSADFCDIMLVTSEF